MTVVGFGLGWHSQGARYEPENVAAITLWFGCIGFGFGSIFDKRRPSKGLFIFYRTFTLALIGRNSCNSSCTMWTANGPR